MTIEQRKSRHTLTELEILHLFAVDILRLNDLEDLLWSIAHNVGELLAFEDFVLYLRQDGRLHQRAAYGVKNPQDRTIKNPIVIEIGRGIVGSVAESGRAERSADTTQDTRYVVDEVAGRSELTVPIVYQQNVIGVFDAESTHQDAFTETDLRILQTLANMSAPRIASAIAEAERDKFEDTLRDQETQYRLLAENAADVIWTSGLGFDLTYISPSIERLTGYTPEESKALTAGEFYTRDALKAANAAFREEMQKEQSGEADPYRTRSMELQLKCKDGSAVWTETVVSCIRDTSNAAVGLQGVTRNIAERRQIEDALKRSENNYRTLIQQSPDPILVHDRERLLYANQAAVELSGYERDELLQLTLLDIVHPEDLNIIAARQAKLDEGDNPPTEEFRCRRKDGSSVLIEVHGYTTTFDGQRARIVMGRDVTARKQAERAALQFRDELERRVNERTQELQESEQRYRDFINRSPDVVWRMDREGVFTFMSPAITSISGFDPSEMIGLPFEEFRNKFLVGDSNDDARKTLERRMRGDFGTGEINYELSYYRKDGSQYTAELRSVPILDEDGNIVEFHGTTRDISERKLAEEERAKLEVQLRQSQKMEAVGKLAGGIAHDFNNLLTAINGYSELLLEGLEPDDPLYEGLHEIGKAGERAATLTRQLLAFSRKQILQPKVIDLGETIAATENILRRLIGEHITFELDCEKNLGKVEADPGQIDQVILNLVVNARDALPRGGVVTLSIDNVVLGDQLDPAIRDLPAGDYVRLSIADTGVGMSEEELAKIFEPFYTTKGAEEGTGLGLSTVFGIVKQSGGGIHVESEPGRGSIFRVYLPRVEASEPVSEEQQPLSSPIAQGGETILLVEDEEVIRTLLERTLEKLGYTVLSARHGRDALLNAERYEGPIDLMITDVVMPEMSGHELVAHLAPLRPHMSVLYISGYSEKIVTDLSLADQNIQFLHKPFSTKDVAKKIREMLDEPASTRTSVSG